MAEFTSIGKLTGPAYYPRDVFERLGGKPIEQEAVRDCTICGEIQPRPVAVRGYLSGKCVCQKQEEMRQRRLAVWKELQEEVTLLDFERLGGKSTQQEAVWSCVVCGEIQPYPVTIIGYLPSKCSCQQQEEKRQERLQVWKDQEEERARRIRRCYTWLSPDRQPVPREWQTMTLESFKQEQDMQSNAFIVALGFLERREGNLIFWASSNGSGKTHLATAICNHLLQEWSCLFAGTYDLFRAIESRWDNPEDHQDSYSDLIRQAVRCDLLILDDISRVRKYRKEFDEILDGRHQRRRPTIITLNADLVKVTDRGIVGVSEYIGLPASDRLCDVSVGGLTVCEMYGESWRRRKR